MSSQEKIVCNAVLEQWIVRQCIGKSGPFEVIDGLIHDDLDARWPNGTPITTSKIIQMFSDDEGNQHIKTRNSTYKLGQSYDDWLDEMEKQMTTKSVLESVLHNGISEIVFTKADDSVRVMYGTLDNKIIEPVAGRDTTAGNKRVPSPDVVRVFDVSINEWRSFRIDKLVSINGAPAASIEQLCTTMNAVKQSDV